jgi:hypothetical protein
MNDIDLIYSVTIEKVKEIAKAAENVYGNRIMKHALSSLRYPVSRLKERQLMNETNVWVRILRTIKPPPIATTRHCLKSS